MRVLSGFCGLFIFEEPTAHLAAQPVFGDHLAQEAGKSQQAAIWAAAERSAKGDEVDEK